MALRENLYFWRGFRDAIDSVGAIWPTLSVAGQAMAAEFACRIGPRRVLEVGAGTGSITAEIVRHMGPDDELVLCELNPQFVTYLRQRLEQDPLFLPHRGQITLHHMDVLEIDINERFDFIISAIPFTNCPAAVVKEIFECYQTILKPDGVLSFIEYAYVRSFKQHLLTPAAREQAAMVNRVMEQVLEGHLFRRDFVLRNLPPVWIRHLRFQPAEPSDALALKPLTHNRRIPLAAKTGVVTEAMPLLSTLFGLGILFRHKPRLLALIGLIAAGVVAFFRDPIRSVDLDPEVAMAAADGRVLAVERLRDTRFGDVEWLRIAVSLAITDVHINRSPIAGKVVQILSQKGDLAIPASNPKAEHNHAVYTVIEGHKSRCVVAQRVGIVARRIVNWTQSGTLLAQGERYGLIRFGSRTDVYLPANLVEPCVTVGDNVAGGVTVLARYRSNISK